MALLVLPHLLNYQVFAMFRNGRQLGRLPREGEEAARSPGLFRSCLGGRPGSAAVHFEPSWIDILCQDEWNISIWLSNRRVTVRPGEREQTVIDAHIDRYPEIQKLSIQYWREEHRFPGFSPVLEQELDNAFEEISRLGEDNQAAEKLAHYALVFGEMTSINGERPSMFQSAIRKYITKKLDRIRSRLHPQIKLVFEVLEKEWNQSRPLMESSGIYR
ncbi:hypothetical protein MJO28_013760 [Puccinia striiformis f. sp. tritici]|uniref:Uncharacterized protein n=1 Tax=Puccinia striiformis f. sp. tritici TaxID=168172 RepID=A0ACC0DWR9_9BASI|nr:hypothetical protein MJO28_013760 [Puccinia striiformis f. sp. tritici]